MSVRARETGKRQFRRERQRGETKRRTGKLRSRNAQLKKNKVSRGNATRNRENTKSR